MKIKKLICPICRNANIEYMFVENDFKLYKCNSCTTQFIYPLPDDDELNEAYSDPLYHKETRYETNQLNSAYQRLWEKRLKRINYIGYQKGFLLDIGCATGNFLKIAENLGWDITGIEKSTNAAKIAKERLGNNNIKLNDLLTTNFDHQFNVVTAWALIEHVLNPLAYFEKMNELLIEEGLLVISTPNTSSIGKYIQKKKWRYYIPPHHLFYFNTNNIKKILFESGFKITMIKTIFSYRNLFEEESGLNLLYQKNKLFRILIKIVFFPLKMISDLFSLGDTLEVYATKCKK
jgi:2-polyprenyl-3-methyl-5-hydroxy-6-metoxy-1,4-benzoquinol methylase